MWNSERQFSWEKKQMHQLHLHFCWKYIHTYDVKGEVGAAAHLPGSVFGTAVVDAVIIRTGAGDSQRSFFIVDLVALLC